MLCEYGCGNIAKFPPKKGMKFWCCSDNWRKCPAKRTYKNFLEKEKEKLLLNKNVIKELDGSNININNIFRSRRIIVRCIECNFTREMTLSDYLICKTNLCKSCCKKGDLNVSKRADVRKKLSRKGVKDTRYATHEWREKFSNSRKGKKNPNYGKPDSDKTRRLKRMAAISNIRKRIKNGGQLTPSYNMKACKLIDKFGKHNGYNFQHAENGGEYHIKELGYWVDGYDKKQNVVIEIDESHHFDSYKNLSKKDIRRQNEITKFLNCKFIRLKI